VACGGRKLRKAQSGHLQIAHELSPKVVFHVAPRLCERECAGACPDISQPKAPTTSLPSMAGGYTSAGRLARTRQLS
jgi:hypothetical protein